MPPNYESHIVPRKPFILPLQGCIILLSAVVVGLTTYAVSFNFSNSHNGNGSDDGNGFALGIAIATIILTGYFFLTHIIEGASVIYHRTFVLLLLIAGFLCWIAVFITLTEKLAGTVTCVKQSNGIVTCTRKSDVDGVPWRNEMITADAIAGVMCFLFFVNLIEFSLALHLHRQIGAPSSHWEAQKRRVNPVARRDQNQLQVAESQPGFYP